MSTVADIPKTKKNRSSDPRTSMATSFADSAILMDNCAVKLNSNDIY